MGVATILQPILRSAGRPIDLRDFSTRSTGKGKRMRTHRLRVGIDVSGWIQRACFGFSEMLASDEYLTNHGRATLLQQGNPPVERGICTFQCNDDIDGNDGNGKKEFVVMITSQRKVISDNGNKIQDSGKDVNVSLEQYVSKCIEYVMKRIEILQDKCNLDVLVVLEGKTPPVKQNAVHARRSQRQKYIEVRDNTQTEHCTHNNCVIDDASTAEAAMNKWFVANRRAGAGKHFTIVVQQLMKVLRQSKIPFLVSPYEADGQLAYLSQCNHLDLVVTDDSDLIVSCSCPIVYKLFDQHFGNGSNSNEPIGILVRPREDLGALSIDTTIATKMRTTDFLDYTPAMLAALFVLLGCDYSFETKVKGIGIVTACRFIHESFYPTTEVELKMFERKSTAHRMIVDKKEKDATASNVTTVSPLYRLFQKLRSVRMTKLSGNTSTTATEQINHEEYAYQKRFMSAIIMYRHPVVYDPIQGRCVASGPVRYNSSEPVWGDPELISYTPYRDLLHNEKQRFINITGEPFESPIATYIAEGWISPNTLHPHCFDDVCDADSDLGLIPKDLLTYVRSQKDSISNEIVECTPLLARHMEDYDVAVSEDNSVISDEGMDDCNYELTGLGLETQEPLSRVTELHSVDCGDADHDLVKFNGAIFTFASSNLFDGQDQNNAEILKAKPLTCT